MGLFDLFFGNKPQLQEVITEEIKDYLVKLLKILLLVIKIKENAF